LTKNIAVFIITALFVLTLAIPVASAQATPIQKAARAFNNAEQLESELNEKPVADRKRNDYVRVIEAYQRVYLITPHTGYADNALMAMARLYEEIKDSRAAIRTLSFLLREYPGSPFRDAAEKDLARLQGVPDRKTLSVDNIRFWDAPDSVRIVVDLSGEIQFKQGEAKSPDRIFLDIGPARLNSMLLGKQWQVNSPLLQQIRVGQYDGTTVRVVLDVVAVTKVNSFILRDPDRLVVDVLGSGAATTSTTPVSTAAAAATPVPAPKPAAADARPPVEATKPVETAARPVTPAKPTGDGNRSLIRALGLKLSRVVIDAGHGGHDTGSIGPTGLSEKDLVLDIAQRLEKLIETEIGTDVVMTRTDDSFIPLETRTAAANRNAADLFISIHANSSRVRNVRGVETFFLNFTTSKEALEVASRENAASEHTIHELQDIARKIMLREKVDESRELANHIQKALVGNRGASYNRGVKQAPFVVLIGANMPSVLAEISFISNPDEEKRLKAPEYRQQIAQSLFDGVRSYVESLGGSITAKAQDKN